MSSTGGNDPNPYLASLQGQPDDQLDLGAALAVLLGAWRLILAALALCLLGTAVYLLQASPIYRADGLVQVESKGNVLDGMKGLSDEITRPPQTQTEIEIMRSRSVLGPVIDQLDLDQHVFPKRFPALGAFLARRWEAQHTGLAPARLWAPSDAWGGERLGVERIEVPAWSEDRPLTLVALGGDRYRLLGPGGDALLEGSVGTLAQGNGFSIFVSELVARGGTEFAVVKQSRTFVFNQLRSQIAIQEEGEGTGIISLSMKGTDPDRLVKVLNALENTYVRQNVERKSAEAEKTLAFVEAQLPDLKSKLDAAEEALNAYQSRTGAIDLDLKTKTLLDSGVDVDKQISNLQLERSQLLQKFTPEHPAIKTINEQIAALQRSKDKVDAQMKALPTAALKSVQLMRDVRVANDLYLLLLNKAQELKVVKSGTVGNVRVLDPAMADAHHPVWPKPRFMFFAAGVLGLLLGAALAFAKHALNRGIEDPDVLEAMGLPVYASVPYSEKQRRLLKASRGSGAKTSPVLAQVAPTELAVESLRSLRTSLQFSLAESKRNVLLLTGLRPEVGKSFLATNLAAVLASAGQRVLLVDGDIRRGVVHTYFGLERGPGLSEVLSGNVRPEEAARPTQLPNVTVLTTGQLPPNPSELLLGEHFQATMAWAEATFDLVLIDSPPILAVTDAAILARVAGVRLLVLKAGVHPPAEVGLGLGRFEQNGVRIHGAVLNSLSRRSGVYSYGRYGYHYQYEYKASSELTRR